MGDVVEWVLEMDVKPGQADNVLPLVSEMVAATERDEPGAVHYEYFVNPDRSRCTVIERYVDSAAVMVHLGNFGAKFADRFFAAFAPARFTVYGAASDEVRAALADFGPGYEERIAGFQR